MMPRARIKLLILALAAAAAVHAFAPVRVQQRPTLLPRARATTGPAGSGSDGALVMSAAAASSGGYSGGSISNRPTAGGGAATRPLKRRAPVSNTYSFLDFLIGPFAADCKIAGVPSELVPFATDLHRATGHLPRADRVQALSALVSGYNCLRKRGQKGGAGAAALTLMGGRTATLGAVVEQMVQVGVLLGQSDVDGPAITAALLCPCAMGGCLDAAGVEAEFGAEVAAILRGFQAMLMVESQLEMKALLSDYAKFLWGSQGDHLRNLLLVVAKDWRAVALRVAWKKVELEAGPFRSKKEEIDSCWAGLNIYASLAEKAGMSLVKNAIEERAFRFLMPGEYARVSAQLEARGEQHRRVLQQARKEVMQALLEDGAFMNAVARVEVKGRIKAPYSVWRKTKARNCTVDELYDLIALRVVVTPLPDATPTAASASATAGASPEEAAERRAATGKALCDYALGLVHTTRPHVPGRFKDYISAPKPNGYQSLHTTLAVRLRGKATPVEVQVRTAEMHAVAEHGLAAHALYKGDRTLEDVITAPGHDPAAYKSHGDWLSWCQRMLEQSSVIVFSPEGRLVRMKKGATLLDFVRLYYGSVGALKGEAARRRRSSSSSSGSRSASASAAGGFARPWRKRSERGMMLVNGAALSLDRELRTGDVITSL